MYARSLILSLYWLYLNRPPQCWHWSPTQPGKHKQLPVAVLHCPFMHGLSHSFASVKLGGPNSSPMTESRSTVFSIDPRGLVSVTPRLRLRPKPVQARRIAPSILTKDGCLRQALHYCGITNALPGYEAPWFVRRCDIQYFWYMMYTLFVVTGLNRLLRLHLSGGYGSIAAPSRILTSGSDVSGLWTATEMRNDCRTRREGLKLPNYYMQLLLYQQ